MHTKNCVEHESGIEKITNTDAYKGGRIKMQWIEMLQKGIDYVEEHLLEDIHFHDVAKQLNLSPYEFYRAFSFMSGMTLNSYIRNRRLSMAGQELAETDKKIIDIAMKYGFESQDGFTKAFTRFHGVSPKYAKTAGTQLVLFNPLAIKVSLEGGRKIDYRIEKKEKQRFLAIVRAFPTEIIQEEGNNDISDFWEECHSRNMIEPIKTFQCDREGRIYGLCAPLKENETYFEYGIGVLLNSETACADDILLKTKEYRYWETEPCTYVVFKCIGESGECIGEAWELFYKEFLPQSGYKSCIESDYEVYFDERKYDVFCELWIPIKK